MPNSRDVLFSWFVVQVRRYPTLAMYYGRGQIHHYAGDRDVDSLRQFVLDSKRKRDEL